jgi:hypothetical protein
MVGTHGYNSALLMRQQQHRAITCLHFLPEVKNFAPLPKLRIIWLSNKAFTSRAQKSQNGYENDQPEL